MPKVHFHEGYQVTIISDKGVIEPDFIFPDKEAVEEWVEKYYPQAFLYIIYLAAQLDDE